MGGNLLLDPKPWIVIGLRYPYDTGRYLQREMRTGTFAPRLDYSQNEEDYA